MPWELIGTIFLGLVKWIFERQAKKKLNDVEFLKHIEAHQKRRANAGQSAQDFDDAMSELEADMDKTDEKPPLH